ncbi:hypothetical protein QBC39DRAFT_77449 [Podospora conica]|nr:hypothetical protein QBC39DRAFT_77449 [Schizothecium conicum]
MEFVKSHAGAMSASSSRLSPLPSSGRSRSIVEYRKKTLSRALVALPLLGLCIVAYHIMSTSPALPYARVLIDKGEVVWDDGKQQAKILTHFYNVEFLDYTITTANMFFLQALYGYDSTSRTQTISFLADGGIVLAIWWLESFRQDTKAKKSWYLQYPSMIALAGQLIGLGVVAPLYSFLSLLPAPPPSEAALPSHHATISTPLLSTRDPSPSSSTSSSPSRGGRRTLNPFHLLPTAPTPSSRKSAAQDHGSPATTLLPALLLAYYLPAALMLFHPVPADRQAWLFIWQLFPVYLAVASFVLSRVPLSGKRRTDMQKLDAEARGTRVCVGALVVLAVGVWWWTWVGAGVSGEGMRGVFVPGGVPGERLPSLEGFAAEFLRWDEVFVFAGVLGWLGVVGAAVGSVVVLGPGATAGMGWLWREEVVFRRREKEVLLREVEAKVEELLRANGA